MATTYTIPATLDDIDAGWLTDRLHEAGALDTAATITGFRAEPIGLGLGVLALLHRLTLDADPAGAGPATLVVKLASRHEPTREVVAGYRFYEREVAVYRELAARTTLRAPECYAAAYDPASGDFVLLMADLSDRRTADQVTGCAPADAATVVDVLARHHAQWWQCPELLEVEVVQSPAEPPYPQFQAQSTKQAWPHCREVLGDLLPPAFVELGERWPEVGPRIMEMAPDRPWTFGHGDVRLDNIFFGDGPDDLRIVDWQICFRTTGAGDLAYFLGQSLTVDDRRAHEADLLRRYHEGLRAGDVDDYPFDELMYDYRLQTLFGFAYPLTAAGQLDLVNDRAVALVRSMMQRCVAAIEDHDALTLA